MKRYYDLGSENGSIRVLGTIKGLVCEKELVKKAVMDQEPEIIALHISKEEIRGLGKVVDGKVKNTYLSSYEKVYARELSRFGEVQIPPPSLVEAYGLSKEMEIPLRPLDFNEVSYSRIYTQCIDGLTMMRQSLRQKRVNRKKFRSTTAEEFCLEWDRTVNRLKGFRMLEDRREKRMSSRIIKLGGTFKRMLAVVELERMDGILEHLRSSLSKDH